MTRNVAALHPPRLRRLAATLLLSVTGLACAPAPPAPVVVAVDGRSNEHVTVAAAGQFVALAWAASTTGGVDVYGAVSRDGGSSFSAPVRVNAAPFDARVGGEQPPHVALVPRQGAEPTIVVVWTSRRPEGSRLLTASSSDGGATYGTTSVVPGGEAVGNRGWESVAVDGAGHVLALWLDHRDAAAPAAMHHQPGSAAPATAAPAAAPTPKPDPVEKAGLSRLYFASLDSTVAPKSITGGVCYCCKTSLTASPDGGVYGVWRHVYPGNQRDIAFVASRDGGRTFSAPVRVSEDHWAFDGCPENGPAVAVDGGRRAHVVWPTPADTANPTSLALFYATSHDGGPFTPRVRLPAEGPAAHAQLAVAPDGSLVVAWDELAPGGRVVRLARGTPGAAGGATFRTMDPPDATPGRYPALATTSSGTVVAWVRIRDEGNVIAVGRVPR